MEVNPPTHPECQKACQIMASSIIQVKSGVVAISYNNVNQLLATTCMLMMCSQDLQVNACQASSSVAFLCISEQSCIVAMCLFLNLCKMTYGRTAEWQNDRMTEWNGSSHNQFPVTMQQLFNCGNIVSKNHVQVWILRFISHAGSDQQDCRMKTTVYNNKFDHFVTLCFTCKY